MLNKRLTKMNQFGDILYCGPRDADSYKNMGLYPEDMDSEQILLVLTRLYYMEELIEALQEQTTAQEITIRVMEKVYADK